MNAICHPSVHPTTHEDIHLSSDPFILPSINPVNQRSIYQSIPAPILLSIHPSNDLLICQSSIIRQSIHLFSQSSIHPTIHHLDIYPSCVNPCIHLAIHASLQQFMSTIIDLIIFQPAYPTSDLAIIQPVIHHRSSHHPTSDLANHPTSQPCHPSSTSHPSSIQPSIEPVVHRAIHTSSQSSFYPVITQAIDPFNQPSSHPARQPSMRSSNYPFSLQSIHSLSHSYNQLTIHPSNSKDIVFNEQLRCSGPTSFSAKCFSYILFMKPHS